MLRSLCTVGEGNPKFCSDFKQFSFNHINYIPVSADENDSVFFPLIIRNALVLTKTNHLQVIRRDFAFSLVPNATGGVQSTHLGIRLAHTPFPK